MDKWEKFSKKVYLIHSQNDRVIKFKNFKENISILESPPENQLTLKKGGHSMKKNEMVLVGASLGLIQELFIALSLYRLRMHLEMFGMFNLIQKC